MICLVAFVALAVIQFLDAKILFVGGQIAMDAACCCAEFYCELCADETPAPQLKATIGGMPLDCCFANGDYVLDWEVNCEWIYYTIGCGDGCNLVAMVQLLGNGHYYLLVYMGGTCWGDVRWRADLGTDKPDCSTFDLDLPMLSFTPLPNTNCDWSNSTCHVTSL